MLFGTLFYFLLTIARNLSQQKCLFTVFFPYTSPSNSALVLVLFSYESICSPPPSHSTLPDLVYCISKYKAAFYAFYTSGEKNICYASFRNKNIWNKIFQNPVCFEFLAPIYFLLSLPGN